MSADALYQVSVSVTFVALAVFAFWQHVRITRLEKDLIQLADCCTNLANAVTEFCKKP